VIYPIKKLKGNKSPCTDQIPAMKREIGLLSNYYLGDQIKKNEMGRARGTYRKEQRCI
jgi:hypothetical protein